MRLHLLALLGALSAAAGCLAPLGPDALPARVAHAADGAPLPIRDALALVGPLGPLRLAETGIPGAEPNVGVTREGVAFVTSLDHVLRSTDGGASWHPVLEFQPLGIDDPQHPEFDTADPMLWVDEATGRVMVHQLYPALGCSVFAFSDDAGASWTEKPATCATPGVDHHKLVAGPYAEPRPPLAGLAYASAVYYCYNKGEATMCARSDDGGLTYPVDVPVATELLDRCAGLNGHPAIAPDGTIYVPFHARSFVTGQLAGSYQSCGAPHVSVSRDNGLTWTVQRSPATTGIEGIDEDLAVTPDGTAYLLYEGADHRQWLARSRDGFATWEGPWLASAPGVTSTAFSAIAARGDGRLAIAYLGTSDTAESPHRAPDATRWHLYVAEIAHAEGTPAFLTDRATPLHDPIQIGCIDIEAENLPCRNLLDFIDATVAPDGTLWVAVADGCLPGCDEAEESRLREVLVVTRASAHPSAIASTPAATPRGTAPSSA